MHILVYRKLKDAGVDTTGRLLISDRAHLLFGIHKVSTNIIMFVSPLLFIAGNLVLI